VEVKSIERFAPIHQAQLLTDRVSGGIADQLQRSPVEEWCKAPAEHPPKNLRAPPCLRDVPFPVPSVHSVPVMNQYVPGLSPIPVMLQA
jgi:hypothetical protein